MKQTWKRLTALLLALSMALSLLCTSAWAAEVTPADESAEPVAEEIMEAPDAEEAPVESAEAVVEPEVPEVPAEESAESVEEAPAQAALPEEKEELNTDSYGTCGDNLTWDFDFAGTLTIRGTGDMYNYYLVNSRPWKSCGPIERIVIEPGVTSIGAYAFENFALLTSVSIADTVTSIGPSAFAKCTKLSSITLPSNLTSLKGSAFSRCSSLTSIIIPDTVTEIGGSAFELCDNLTSVTLPSKLTCIDTLTFSYCSKLTNITIPDTVTEIGFSAFSYCTGLTQVTIPKGIKTIQNNAFNGCTNLTTIYGYSGTAAETYAKENNISFVSQGIVPQKNTITASNITKNYSTKKQTVSIKAKATSGGKLTYSSNNKSITVNSSGQVTIKAKYIGTATITIKAPATSKYKAATKTITVTARPTGTTITSFTNPSTGKLTVKWKKNSLATGYQIQYSYYDTTFEKGAYPTVTISKKTTTSKTVTYSTLDRTYPYYVRVRTYKTVNGKKIYSAWSKVKTIKKVK